MLTLVFDAILKLWYVCIIEKQNKMKKKILQQIVILNFNKMIKIYQKMTLICEL